MEVYSSSGGLQQVIGCGPHSVVVAHHNHNHPKVYHQLQTSQAVVLPPRPVPKVTTSYQFLPIVNVVPSTFIVPIQQERKPQPPQKQSIGKHFHLLSSYNGVFLI